MKGQMFIITMLFLIALIFAVQNSLAQYNSVDLSKSLQNTDPYLLQSIRNSFAQAIETPKSCGEVQEGIEELGGYFNNRIVGGTSISISHSFQCSPDRTLLLTVKLKSSSGQSSETFTIQP